MKAVDVICRVAEILGDNELDSIITKKQAGEELSTKEEKRLSRAINGLNIAVDTICSRYYSCSKTVHAISDNDAKVSYKSLASRVYEIEEVTTVVGEKVEFYALPFSVYLPASNCAYNFKIKVLPTRVTAISDEVEVMPFIDDVTIAYLMISDIMLSVSSFDESKFWFSKFEERMIEILSRRRTRFLAVKRLI